MTAVSGSNNIQNIVIARNVDIYQNNNPFLSLPSEMLTVIFSFLKQDEKEIISFSKELSKISKICIRTLQIVQIPFFNGFIESAKASLKALKEIQAQQKRQPVMLEYYDWPGSAPSLY